MKDYGEIADETALWYSRVAPCVLRTNGRTKISRKVISTHQNQTTAVTGIQLLNVI